MWITGTIQAYQQQIASKVEDTQTWQLLLFSQALQEAQSIAAAAERMKKAGRKRKKHYTKNSMQTKQHWAEKCQQIRTAGKVFISGFFCKRTEENKLQPTYMLDTGLLMDLWQLCSTLPLLCYTSNPFLQFNSVLFLSHHWPSSIHPCFPLVSLFIPASLFHWVLFPSYHGLLVSCILLPTVKYQSPMDLQQVCPAPSSSTPSIIKSVPISITSLTPLHSSLSPLSHPLSLCSLFHWYPFPCHYDPLISRI